MTRETFQSPLGEGGSVKRLIEAVLAAWPQHAPFIERHFFTSDPANATFIDALAGEVLTLAGDNLATVAADYRWMCALFLKSELQYRRGRKLHHTDVTEIRSQYYDNAADMHRYMHGLLVSQVTWPQHLGVQIVFKNRFLPLLPDKYRYLEIGPGHGIATAIAGKDPRCGSLAGYDISPASIAQTKASLARMGITRDIKLELMDISEAPHTTDRFDAIAISQVLELVASPPACIDHLARILAPGGILFVNCPVRMLAPDHIRRWEDSSEIDALIGAAGLDVLEGHKIHVDRTSRDDAQGYSYVALASRPRGRPA